MGQQYSDYRILKSMAEKVNLTKRELEILGHLIGYASLRSIAASIEVTVETLRWHISNLYRKTGTRSRSELQALFAEDMLADAMEALRWLCDVEGEGFRSVTECLEEAHVRRLANFQPTEAGRFPSVQEEAVRRTMIVRARTKL